MDRARKYEFIFLFSLSKNKTFTSRTIGLVIFLVPHIFQKYIQTAMIITVINFRYAEDTTLRAESKELKSLMMRVKEESANAGLKLNIQKTKIMATGSITSQQTDGGKVETVTDFIFLGSKITVDGD